MRDEFRRIAELIEVLRRRRPHIRIGMGDDAAVLEPSDAAQVLTVDTAVSGVHFLRDLSRGEDIAYRAFVAAASDVAAMGARARAALTALVLPADVDDDLFRALVDGLGEASDATGAPIVGGNLSSGSELSITTTVVGELEGEALTRGGARAGDGVYVTGPVGGAAVGLALLRAGHRDGDATPFIARYHRPTARFDAGARLRGLATAAIDISDGLVQDLGHIAEASGVNAELDASALPHLPDHARLARELGEDPLALALSGGDDYELIFTAPAGARADALGTRIGRIVSGGGEVRVLGPDGAPLDLEARGYGHFR